MIDRIEILQNYLLEDPEDNFSRYALALEHLAKGNLEKAGKLLTQLLEKDPSYLAAYYQLGKILEKQKDTENAIRIYETGIEVAGWQKNMKTLSELRSALNQLTGQEDWE